MKKEYMKPQVEVVRVKTCLPLADSLHGLSNTVGLEYGGKNVKLKCCGI